MKITTLALIVCALFGAAPLAAQSAGHRPGQRQDPHGRRQFSIRQALADPRREDRGDRQHGGRAEAGGATTRVIDLQGRTVIPGLIDSHLHAIRAALSFSTEVNWIGAPSLDRRARRASATPRAR